MKLQLAIQHIEITWGKEARGADGHGRAAERNAVPREASFQPPGTAEQGWFQHVLHASADRFEPRERWTRIEEMERHISPVRWRQEGDFFRIGIRNLFLQKPRRPHLHDYFARLPIGQRVILRVNAAWDWDGHARHYAEHHIAVGVSQTATLDLPLFRDIDERALLY